jgi:hypothetical protein
MFSPSSLGDFPPLKYIEYLSRGARYFTDPSQPSMRKLRMPASSSYFSRGTRA